MTDERKPRDGKETGRASVQPPARSAPFSQVAPPGLGLPSPGGALRAIGEKFKAGGPTGTGACRIPLPISPCRGVEPRLALQYDSGHGNGIFGIGWSLSLPEVSRRTDKGVPRYQDATESDVFMLSDHDELVPELVAVEGGWTRVTADDGEYRVEQYRPRVEGAFARVERRTHKLSGDAHWRAITPDNVTSVFGLSASARIANPLNPLHIYRWLLEATFDSYGNAVFYEYRREDLAGVDPSDPSEASRLGRPAANAYLKRIHYGNRTPLSGRNPTYADLAGQSWLFEVVLDYGEHTTDLPIEAGRWTTRPDPFSFFRAGFEIRTYRLCQRVLMFHEMPEQLARPARLVKALEIEYDASPSISYLTSARQAGYAWNASEQVSVAYMPSQRLDYTRVGSLSTAVSTIDTSSLAQAPVGLDDSTYTFVDLDGEGIAGILAPASRPTAALYYKRNLGNGSFAPAERLPMQPAMLAFSDDVRLVSLNSDGRLDVATFGGPSPGFFERTREGGWKPFSTFRSLPSIDLRQRGVHLLDVDGDGLTDVLLAEDDVFVWYPSLARDGFGPPHRVTHAHDGDRGAVVLTTEDYESIFLADMSGDGLADIVRIRNGEIAYWPNLGYGRFGAKITMKSAPHFDTPDRFDPRRIRLADVDGTGTTDVVYLSSLGATVYMNEAGNGWSSGVTIPLPLADGLAAVRVVDLFGTGTSCLVWSSPEPASAGAPMRYVDLLRSTKPHLLRSLSNGFGAETTITYAPSTKFYLEDRAAGRPWATRLPFPVQTVERVETTDSVAGTQFVMRYRYAHGFYDGVEREFRGFARVDSWDSEAMSSAHGAGSPPAGVNDSGGEYVLTPMHTISWFHTGAWNGERDDLRTALTREFYAGDSLAAPLARDALAADLSPPALREGYRALKGRLLRQEIFADDNSAAAAHPYAVTDFRYEIREVQPLTAQRHGVYHAFERERLVYHYERDPSDPRIEHDLALEVDPLGHVVREAHLAYARRSPAEPEQARTLATCAATTLAAPLVAAYEFRHGITTDTTHYELSLGATAQPLAFGLVDAAMTSSAIVPFDETLAAGTKRTIERIRRQYWADDLSGPLPIGSVGARALLYDQFAFALPATLLVSAFAGKISSAEMPGAGYVSPDGDFWIHAGVTGYDPGAFYQATSFTDPFGNTSHVVFDALKLYVVEQHTSALAEFDNVTTATLDYRVLAPSFVIDPNGNRGAAAFDELGMVVAVAHMGRSGANEGETLDDPTIKLEYDLTATPAYVHRFARRVHGPSTAGWLESYTYSDGSGHEVLAKTQAEPENNGPPRWIGSGRTVFDNKGNPVKKYEPYFASNPNYDAESALATSAYCEIVTYDPLSRVIRTDVSDGTFSTISRTPWEQISADANDNVLQSAWYADAIARPLGDPLRRAAQLTAQHANTPSSRAVDPLGRTFLVIDDNGSSGTFATRITLDIQGDALGVTDALGNATATRTFDALGRAIVSAGVDTGTSAALGDAVGGAFRSWDARGFEHRTEYDALHRMVRLWTTPPNQPELLAELVVYGEGVATPNLRGRVYLRFDGSGVVANTAYDLDGHVTRMTQQLARTYTTTASWSSLIGISDPSSVLTAAGGLLEADVFETQTVYDALDHIVQLTMPDGSVVTTSYDAGARLKSVSTSLRGAAPSDTVSHVSYNAAGQRIQVTGSGVVCNYVYDPRTRLTSRIATTRVTDGATLQDLTYTHDPVGNIVEVDDAAQQTVYFAGAVTTGTQQFEYDPLYRLVHATGREHPGQVGFALGNDGYPEAPLSTIPHRNDLQALVPYTEDYTYDALGNLQVTAHAASGSGWTRTQTLVAGTNRIATVTMPGDPSSGPFSGLFDHDASGNLTRMPNLSTMTWDHAGRFVRADLGGGGVAYFTYDARGQRVRKVVERGGKRLERVYIGPYERYRELQGTSATVTLERESLHVLDGERRFALIETKTIDTSGIVATPTPKVRFQLPNHLGSSCVEVDEAGAVVAYEEYYPYGGTSFRAGDPDKRYRYAGKEHDEETGLYCIGLRYYAPWLARWTSPDPGGLVDGTNLYRYVHNNPVGLSDPAGMYPGAESGEGAEAAAEFVRKVMGRIIAGMGAGVAPVGATPPMAAPAAVALPEAGEALVFMQPLALGASIAGTGYLSFFRQNSIVQYGNAWGARNPGMGILDHIPPPLPLPKPQPKVDPKPDLKPDAPTTPRDRTKPDDDERRDPKQTVNLDTTAIVAATSVRDPFIAIGLNAYFLNKRLVATQTALKEVTTGNVKSAGPIEKFALAVFLLRVEAIPDNPSERVKNLRTDSNKQRKAIGANDKIIFGTGDRLGIKTVGADKKFVEAAAKQGVVLDVLIHPSNPYAGK